MVSYPEARNARDAAFDLVSNFGATVLTVKPKQRKKGWVVLVETARPLTNEIPEHLEVDGVPVELCHRRASDPRAEMRKLAARWNALKP